ncbi:MAG: hypothetical protein AAFZ10_15605, partial [Pseudomonadota bacterium]
GCKAWFVEIEHRGRGHRVHRQRRFKIIAQEPRLATAVVSVEGQKQLRHPMAAPTVFNFYKPGFAPHGDLQGMGLKAPEFQLHTSATSVAYVNLAYQWFMEGDLPLVSTQIGQGDEQRMVMEMYPPTLRRRYGDVLRFDFKDEIEMAKDQGQHDALIERMSVLLTGHVDPDLKARIQAACIPMRDRPERLVQTIGFMIAVSPEFTVQEA